MQTWLFDQNQQCKYQISFWLEAKLSSCPFLPHPIPHVPSSFLRNLQHPPSHQRKPNLCKRGLELGAAGTCLRAQGPCCPHQTFPIQTTGNEPTRPLGCGPCTCEPTLALRWSRLCLGREKPHVSKWLLQVASCDQREANSRSATGCQGKLKRKEFKTRDPCCLSVESDLSLCKLAIPFQTASEDFQYLNWTHYQTQTNSRHGAPSHQNILSPDKKDSVHSQLPSSPSACGYRSGNLSVGIVNLQERGWHFTSKGKIVTKAQLLNSLPFPHLKEFSVLRRTEREQRPRGQHRLQFWRKDWPTAHVLLIRCSCHTENTLQPPFYDILHILSINHI